MIVATFQNGTMQVLTKDTVEGISKEQKEEGRRS